MFLTPPTKRINKFCEARLNVHLKQHEHVKKFGNTSWSSLGAKELQRLRSNLSLSNADGRLYPSLHVFCAAEDAVVAVRALAIIGGGEDVAAYYLGWEEAQSNAYHEQTNPSGCIQLGLSENKVSCHSICLRHDTAPAPDLESVLGFIAIAGYPDVYHGLEVFRSLLASFMDDIFGRAVQFHANQMVVTTGATAAIELLAFCLADPGDVFLVPSPYYPGFDRDIKFRSQVSLVPVQSSSENKFLMTREVLEQTYNDTLKTGRKVRAILMTSPSNPLGTTYNEDYLRLILDFVKEKDLHLICDEIYAGTTYGQSKFVSMAGLSVSQLYSSRVHIVYGLSKILGLPGYRVGLLYSWNSQVLDAARKLTRFSSLSTHTQQLLVALLSDKQFLRSYLSENQRRLGERWQLVRHGLEEAGMEFIECESGFFCWVNLGNLLDARTRDDELKLFKTLLYEVGINMTPGSACHCVESGWFRLCFALVDDKTIAVALNRIQQFAMSTERDKQSRVRYL
ncbi:unnamed protein product [Calypogeia fissa]